MLNSTNATAASHIFGDSRVDLPDTNQTVRFSDSGQRILRLKELIERTKLSRATLYVLMASDPYFPRKIKLTARAIGFFESEVDVWLAHRANLGRAED